jgi:hypothetical protein
MEVKEVYFHSFLILTLDGVTTSFLWEGGREEEEPATNGV